MAPQAFNDIVIPRSIPEEHANPTLYLEIKGDSQVCVQWLNGVAQVKNVSETPSSITSPSQMGKSGEVENRTMYVVVKLHCTRMHHVMTRLALIRFIPRRASRVIALPS